MRSYILVLATLTSLAATAQAADPQPSPTPQTNSDKLDVSDLEKKYWAAKDTDFSVVQNRAYSKAKRFAVALMYGPVINDSYSDGFAGDLSLQYFFTERQGIELQYTKNSLKDNGSDGSFVQQYAAIPNFDRSQYFYGVNYNWVPIYAKMSLLNSKIIYFDMAFSPGLGLTGYDQQRLAGATQKTAPTFSFNVTQHFFLSNHFAIRAEFQNRWFNEDTVDQHSGASVSTQLQHDTNLLFGIDYFF